MIELRKYPYPFKAALCISNDTDGMNWKAFRDWHDFVNGSEETRYGPGLGLEVSDSFWFWANGNYFSLYHNHPAGPQARASEYDYIVEMAKAGWLDTLHGFGTWGGDYRVSRVEMERALTEMAALGVRPALYVNHGGGRHMAHNLGGVWGTYQQGDDPSSESYCLDLLLDHGFRYFWTDMMYESDKFGNDSWWPDDRSRKIAFKSYNARRFMNARMNDKLKNLALVCPALGVETEAELREIVFDSIFLPVTMRDGHEILGIKRFRGHYPPDAGSFAHQVNASRLDDLVAREAAVIIYQHFGVWRAFSAPPKEGRSRRRSRIPLLDEHCVWAFRFLAERQERGEIFITTTQRLLDYIHTRDNLRFSAHENGTGLHISLETIECPVQGAAPAVGDRLSGLAFVIDGRPETVTMGDAEGRSVEIERHTDETSTIISVPWRRLVYPH